MRTRTLGLSTIYRALELHAAKSLESLIQITASPNNFLAAPLPPPPLLAWLVDHTD